MKLRCRLGFHRWSEWSEKRLVPMAAVNVFVWTGYLDREKFSEYVQDRECLDCKEAEMRKVRLP